MDPMAELSTVSRNLGSHVLPAGPARMVTLARDFPVGIVGVWDALTNPSRVAQWLGPVTGDLRQGGTYQLEGSAAGQIRVCDGARYLQLTWYFGPPPGEQDSSMVDVTLHDLGPGGTRFEMRHVAVVPHEVWYQYGPGAVGVGWDLTLLGLTAHLRGEMPGADPQGPPFNVVVEASSQAWGNVLAAAENLTEQDLANVVAATNMFYLPPAQ